jgi:low temperature requirement protein LtrA
MAGWSVLLLEGSWPLWGWWTMALAEFAVPIWAERAAQTAWHPHHIAERFGLFTIIVLGESVLAATVAVQTAVDDQQGSTGLYAAVIGGLLTMFSMWWLYFAKPAHRLLVSDRTAFPWGYGHYVIFASAAAVGAGLAVSVDHVTHHTELTDSSAGAAVTVPVVLFLLTLWALHLRPHHTGRVHAALPPITAALILASTMTPQPVLITGLLMTALVVISLITVLKAPRLRHG